MELHDDPLYTPGEAADRLRSNPRTLERWRTTGDGPSFVKVGRRVCYPKSALDEFVQRQTRQTTAAGGK